MSDTSQPAAGDLAQDRPQDHPQDRSIDERFDTIEARVARIEQTVLGLDRNVTTLLQHFTNYILSMEEIIGRQFGPNATSGLAHQPAVSQPVTSRPSTWQDGEHANVIPLFPSQRPAETR